ncbi:hypothetical protein M569_02221, partial [Genlisea aurea]
SESSSLGDLENTDSFYGGEACSVIANLDETIKRIDDFLLFERQFLHGDIVCLASDSQGQPGKVFNVEMTVNMETVDGRKIENADCKNLQRIRSVSADDYVVRGPWLGKVEKTVDHLTVLFDDGTLSHFSADGAEKIISLSQDVVEDSLQPLYPGQRVSVEFPSLKRSARWLCGVLRKNRKEQQGTVLDVDTGVAFIHWLFCADISSEKDCVPSSRQDSKNLTVLSAFPHASWQLGDWCMLPLERETNQNFQNAAVIVKTKTKVDVMWQDGSRSLGLDSCLLLPVNMIEAHDFWPDAFVSEKGTSDDRNFPRYGIVRSVDAREQTAEVKWCKPSSLSCIDFEETVSCYELVEHPGYSFCLGEAVYRVGEEKNGESSSYFGNVFGFRNGYVEVKWADGLTIEVAPYEISRINSDENASAFLQDGVENEEDVKQSFMNSFSSITTGLFDFLRKSYAKAVDDDGKYICEEEDESLKPPAMAPCSSEKRGSFLQFDMVSDFSDHHFAEASGMEEAQVRRSWLKTVHNEWSSLAKDLPETIYVRAYEGRIDLLRAAIVGTQGTPYHDGLFFFDIRLPLEYPNEPPKVHYNSFGLRINPNLYESGEICLSLLNTWTGSESEAWNSKSSSLIQLLLSLQALVLNEKPYFNEAGYDSLMGKAEGEKNAVRYNENALLVNCRSMLCHLNKPPKNFEALVTEHFRSRCRNILTACRAYLNGAPVCNPFSVECCERQRSSTGFRIGISKLHAKLLEAFLEKGFDC